MNLFHTSRSVRIGTWLITAIVACAVACFIINSHRRKVDGQEFNGLVQKVVDALEYRIISQQTRGLESRNLPYPVRVQVAVGRFFKHKTDVEFGFPDRSDNYLISTGRSRFEVICQFVGNQAYSIQVVSDRRTGPSADRFLQTIREEIPSISMTLKIREQD